VTCVATGEEALKAVRRDAPDLIVLDLMLPGIDGLEVCRRLKADPRTRDVPIVMLTAKGEERDVITGLELGADDYITKPFSVREFRSRVKALLRRSAMARDETEEEGGVVEHGELRIDPLKRSVTVGGEPVELTFVEFEMLLAMAASPGRVWSRDQLLGQVWGSSDYRDPRTVDVHVRHLREKIETEPGSPEYLLTVRGVGYRFRDGDE